MRDYSSNDKINHYLFSLQQTCSQRVFFYRGAFAGVLPELHWALVIKRKSILFTSVIYIEIISPILYILHLELLHVYTDFSYLVSSAW